MSLWNTIRGFSKPGMQLKVAKSYSLWYKGDSRAHFSEWLLDHVYFEISNRIKLQAHRCNRKITSQYKRQKVVLILPNFASQSFWKTNIWHYHLTQLDSEWQAPSRKFKAILIGFSEGEFFEPDTTFSSAGGGRTKNLGTNLKKARALLSVATSSISVFYISSRRKRTR